METYQTIEELSQRTLEINKVLQEILDILRQRRLVIEFDSMGGSGVDDVIVYKDQSIGVLPIPVKTGYDFVGWYLEYYANSDGSLEYINEIRNLTTVTLTGKVKLYAKWEPSWVKVLLNPTNGSVQPDEISVKYQEQFISAYWGPGFPKDHGLPTPVHPYLLFDYWYWNAGSGNNLIVNDSTYIRTVSPQVLSAKWMDKNFVLTFDLNGATGYIPERIIPLNSTATNFPTWSQMSNDVNFPGKTFLGWSKTRLARDIVTEFSSVDSNLTAYAVWENKKYHVQYYDVDGNFSLETISYINVPDYAVETWKLPGNYDKFDHWNSNVPYADFLKMIDGDLYYNLTLVPDSYVKLFASTEPIMSSLYSFRVRRYFPDSLSVGQSIVLPQNARASAVFEVSSVGSLETSKISVDVTDAVRLWPQMMDVDTDEIYAIFKFDGDETKYKLYNVTPIPVPEKIIITDPPDKVNYSIGERLDLTGLKAILSYSSNVMSVEISDVISHCRPQNGSVLTSFTNNVVEISYEGKKAYQDLNIRATEKTLNIEVMNPPYKTFYEPGESLNTNGIEVDARISSANSTIFYEDVTGKCRFNPIDDLQRSTREIHVSYVDPQGNTLTSSFEIKVGQNELTSISVNNYPTKQTYNVGESFNPAGINLTFNYSDGVGLNTPWSEISSYCSFDPYYELQTTDKNVLMTYSDSDGSVLTTSIPITVKGVTNSYMTFKLTSGVKTITLRAQNTGVTKYVSYYNDSNELVWTQSNGDDSHLVLSNVKSGSTITCYFDENDISRITKNLTTFEGFAFDKMIFAHVDQKQLSSIGFSNLNKMRIASFTNTFLSCFNLNKVDCPSDLTRLGNNAFRDCLNITNVTLHHDVSIIGSYVFGGCHKLKAVSNSSFIKSIQNTDTFEHCYKLTSINLGLGELSSLYYLPDKTFDGCSSLYTLNIRESDSVVGPMKLSSIGWRCFYNCSSLSSRIMELSGVSYIGRGAFYNCDNLYKAYSNSNLNLRSSTLIGVDAFRGVDNLDLTIHGISANRLSSMANYPWGLSKSKIHASST